jgi:hypothetical protein
MIKRTGIHPDRPFYSQTGVMSNRWWLPARQRVVVLTFPTAEDAERWDANPTLEGIEPA